MSVDATRHVWLRQGLRPAAKLVLLALADRAGEDHVCWPSVDRLVLDTGLNRKTVLLSLAHLAEVGEIVDTGVRAGRTRQVICYRIVGVAGREDTAAVSSEQFQKRNSPKNGTVPKTEQFQKRNSSKNGTVPKTDGKQSQKRTGNSPKNGTRNLKEEPIREPPTYCRSADRPHAQEEDQPQGAEAPPNGDRWFLTRKGRKLTGKRLIWFEVFWEAFDWKHGKAAAADAWLDIRELTNALCQRIVLAAKREAEARPALLRAGHTPKWAQGWITERRWEDEHGPAQPAVEARPKSDYDAMLERMRQRDTEAKTCCG